MPNCIESLVEREFVFSFASLKTTLPFNNPPPSIKTLTIPIFSDSKLNNFLNC